MHNPIIYPLDTVAVAILRVDTNSIRICEDHLINTSIDDHPLAHLATAGVLPDTIVQKILLVDEHSAVEHVLPASIDDGIRLTVYAAAVMNDRVVPGLCFHAEIRDQ